MGMTYWDEVMRTGLAVPEDRPLDDLTADLTTMLGSPDPAKRDGIAYPALTTWIDRGVYDDLLAGLGDGMATGLAVGLGESGTDTVFRRSCSALVLGQVVERSTLLHRVPSSKVLEWGDRIMTWFLRERDTRGYVPGKGWAHALAHGADAIGAFALSPHFATSELTVLLDVIADRLLLPGTPVLTSGEPDRMAAAAMQVLRRNVLGLKVLEPWVVRLARGANAHALGGGEVDPYADTANAQAFLRALYLQLALAQDPPAVRPDLILVLVDALRATNAPYLAHHEPGSH